MIKMFVNMRSVSQVQGGRVALDQRDMICKSNTNLVNHLESTRCYAMKPRVRLHDMPDDKPGRCRRNKG